MERTTLKQPARDGKIKIMHIWTEENVVWREWGYEGMKMQKSPAVTKGRNIGRSNETTPVEQAELEAARIVANELTRGYSHEGTDREDTEDASNAKPEDMIFSLDSLPRSLAPSKPINKPPKDWEAGNEIFCAERKNNGVNLLCLTTPDGVVKTYSRGMKELTNIVVNITPIQDFNAIEFPHGSLSSYEFIYYNADGKEMPKDLRGILNEKTTPEKATARYNKLIEAGGSFAIKVFDILILNGDRTIAGREYNDRRPLLQEYIFDAHPEYASDYYDVLTEEIIAEAKAAGWEGFVLRYKTGDLSKVEYTLNGKPRRCGAYKYVFTFLDDFIIDKTTVGEKGRLLGLPSKFHLSQYDQNEDLVDCGWCGPGKLTTNDLKELVETLELEDLNDKIGDTIDITQMSVAIEHRGRQEDTNSLQFPVLTELRPDKPTEECILENDTN
jgi:hypothetical protein